MLQSSLFKHLSVVIALCTSLAVCASEWNYDPASPHGPSHWGELVGDATCATGLHQSPIDIQQVREAHLAALNFKYAANELSIKNNGHTVQVNISNGSHVMIGKEKFRLLQFHFHTPSEHARHSTRHPMEVHFVHANDAGAFAVVGVFIKEGDANATLGKILANAPTTEGETTVATTINPADLLSSNREYDGYTGSLTTPPCSEGVRWHVMEEPITASADQIAQFQALFHEFGNARPLQNLNDRTVNKSDN